MIDCKELANRILDNTAEKIKSRKIKKPMLLMESYNGDGEAMAKGLAKDCERVGVKFKRTNESGEKAMSFIIGNKVIDTGGECTAEAVSRILEEEFNTKDFSGKTIMVIGRGNVGKYVALKLIEKNATVFICHSKTKFLDRYRASSICSAIVTACNKPDCIDVGDFSDFCSENALIIDCGFEIKEDGKPHGNVVSGAYKNVTPVPGGVGLVTRAIMVERVVEMA